MFVSPVSLCPMFFLPHVSSCPHLVCSCPRSVLLLLVSPSRVLIMFQVEVFTEDSRPEDPGPGTRTGSSLYCKWSAGSGSGSNLLLRAPGLFNFVCSTRVDRRTLHHQRSASVSMRVCNLQFVKLGWEKCEQEIRWKKEKHALPQLPETERGRS